MAVFARPAHWPRGRPTNGTQYLYERPKMTSTYRVQLPRTTTLTNYTLPAGTINSKVIFAYTHGQCHALAIALHEIGHFELCLSVSARIQKTLGLSVEDTLDEELDDAVAAKHWDHAMVRLGDNLYLDIRGLLTENEALYGDAPEGAYHLVDYLVAPTSPRQLLALAKNSGVRPNMDAARHYARLVVKKHLGAPRLAFAN